ncbi:MAG: AsmA family protein [Janthinobacterium lividum]
MRRPALAVFLLILAVPAVAVLASGAVLDSAAGRTRLVAALERATGHAARLDGPVRLAWSLVPSLTAQDVVLLNRPGLSRPVFATVRGIEAHVALLPLLAGRLEVRSVALNQPDIVLERDATGRGNWLPAAAEAAAAPTGGGGPRMAVQVQEIRIADGRVAWLDGPVLAVRTLTLSPSGGPLLAELLVNGVPVAVSGTTGAAGPAPVPVKLAGAGGGLAFTLDGAVGAALALQAQAADLAALSPLAGRALPSLRDIKLTATFGGAGPESVIVTAGATALDQVLPGLQLRQARLDATTPGAPVRIAAGLSVRALPVALQVNLASLSALLAGHALPFQLQAVADGASVAGEGSVADLAGHGLEMTLSARVPDLRRSAALAGATAALPPLTDLALDTRVLPRPAAAGITPGLLLRGLRLTAAQGDIAGDLAIGLTPRPSLRGSLIAQRLDIDALTAAAPPPAAPAPATPAPAPAPPAPAPAGVQPATPAPAARRALPFAALRAMDADLRLAVGQATWHAAAYRGIEARLLLQDGQLRLDPAQMTAPGGPVQLQLLADAAATPPTAAITLRAPALDAAPLAAALGAPGAATGAVELDLQLQGAGADAAALRASLYGHLAAAMVDGEIDNAALAALFGPALRAANLPAEAAGRSRIRCLAVKAEAAAGQVALHTLALDAGRVKLDGEGSLNLVDETMDLHVRPTIRLGGTSVAIPVRLTGPLRAPSPSVERGVVSPGRFGISIGGTAADPCPAALVAVRAR